MKKILLSLMTLTTLTSQATETVTWEEIFQEPNVTLMYEENLNGLHLGNVCLTETEMHSIEDTTYCTGLKPVKKGENKDKWTDWVCQQWVTGAVSYPRNQLPQTIKVRVVYRFSTPHLHGKVFPTQYTFPNCDL